MDNDKETERPTEETKTLQQLQKLSTVSKVSEKGGKLYELIGVLGMFQPVPLTNKRQDSHLSYKSWTRV